MLSLTTISTVVSTWFSLCICANKTTNEFNILINEMETLPNLFHNLTASLTPMVGLHQSTSKTMCFSTLFCWRLFRASFYTFPVFLSNPINSYLDYVNMLKKLQNDFRFLVFTHLHKRIATGNRASVELREIITHISLPRIIRLNKDNNNFKKVI